MSEDRGGAGGSAAPAPPAHRGRVQAQGGGTEKSVPWAQAAPPSAADGRRMLDELHALLTPAEQRAREEAFALARDFIDRAAAKGGVDAPVARSFPRGRVVRVDIEVNKGHAFVP